MAVFVLVHGGNMTTDTWNRLAGRDDYPPGGHLGGRVWESIIPALLAQDHSVFAPTLSDESSSSLAGHIGQVCSLITRHDLKDVILAGHSYGGMVITGTAARMPERIRHLVYVDAALPDPGQSLYDLLTLGLKGTAGPRPELPEPSPPYIEKLQFDPAKKRALPKTYILCTKSEFAVVTHTVKSRISAADKGWTYIELPSSHVPMADMPDELCRLLLDVAKN